MGLCALISPLAVKPLVLRRDALVVVGASVLFTGLAWSGSLGRVDGIVCLACLGGYLFWAYRSEAFSAAPAAEVHTAEAAELSVVPGSAMIIGVAVISGLGLLIGGSRVLVTASVRLADAAGVSEAVIGLTLVAIGTSLPELTVSMMAALRRHADVAVGNILGSNIFNLLGILGVSALLHPLAVHARILQFDQWAMLGAALLLVGFLFTGRRLARVEGGILIVAYLAYVSFAFVLDYYRAGVQPT